MCVTGIMETKLKKGNGVTLPPDKGKNKLELGNPLLLLKLPHLFPKVCVRGAMLNVLKRMVCIGTRTIERTITN